MNNIQKIRAGIIKALDSMVGLEKKRKLLPKEVEAYTALVIAGRALGFVKDPVTGYWYLPEDFDERSADEVLANEKVQAE